MLTQSQKWVITLAIVVLLLAIVYVGFFLSSKPTIYIEHGTGGRLIGQIDYSNQSVSVRPDAIACLDHGSLWLEYFALVGGDEQHVNATYQNDDPMFDRTAIGGSEVPTADIADIVIRRMVGTSANEVGWADVVIIGVQSTCPAVR